MSIVSWSETFERGGKESDKERSYTRSFRVIVDSLYDGPIVAKQAIPVRRGNPYAISTEADFGAWCKSIDAKPDGEYPYHWIVTCEYDTSTPDEDEKAKQDADSPLDYPIEISWDTEIYQRPITNNPYGTIEIVSYAGGVPSVLSTIANNKVVNVNNEAFDPTPTMDDARLILNVSKNHSTFDSGIAFQYTNAVNSDVWFGFPERTAKIAKIAGTKQSEKGITFWKVDYSFQFRFEKWDVEVLNNGYSVRSAAGQEPKYIDATTGQKFSAPVLLDKDGVKLAIAGEPTYLRYRVYREMPFGSLNLL